MSTQGEGWSVAGLDDLGEGYGFRKVRAPLGVEAFGVNAIVMPTGIETGTHYHDVQDELYFVHRGALEFTFGDDAPVRLEAGSFAHVCAATHRKIKNVGDEDAVYVIVGGKDGYVGRDGRAPDNEPRVAES